MGMARAPVSVGTMQGKYGAGLCRFWGYQMAANQDSCARGCYIWVGVGKRVSERVEQTSAFL